MRLACPFCVPLLALAFLGCGEKGVPTGTVAGQVTVAGKPTAEPVWVTFLNSSTGQGSSSAIGPVGGFSLAGELPVGDCKVFLTPAPADAEAAEPVPVKPLKSIPETYQSDAKSPLTKSVVEGKNTIEVEIPGK